MIHFYAIYTIFCILGESSCREDRTRYDIFDNVKQVQNFINYEGYHPNWKNVNGDLVYRYAYGECYKGRKENSNDISMEIFVKTNGEVVVDPNMLVNQEYE